MLCHIFIFPEPPEKFDGYDKLHRFLLTVQPSTNQHVLVEYWISSKSIKKIARKWARKFLLPPTIVTFNEGQVIQTGIKQQRSAMFNIILSFKEKHSNISQYYSFFFFFFFSSEINQAWFSA